jgi:hypothetical protein
MGLVRALHDGNSFESGAAASGAADGAKMARRTAVKPRFLDYQGRSPESRSSSFSKNTSQSVHTCGYPCGQNVPHRAQRSAPPAIAPRRRLVHKGGRRIENLDFARKRNSPLACGQLGKMVDKKRRIRLDALQPVAPIPIGRSARLRPRTGAADPHERFFTKFFFSNI